MIPTSFPILLLLLLGCLAWPQEICAQEEEDADEADRRKGGVPIGQTIRIDEKTIDGWMFSQKSALSARQALQADLVRRIDVIHQLCQLNYHQRAKLRLAGDVEIKRLFDQVEACRQKWSGTVTNTIPNEMVMEMNLVQAAARIRFREGSFFDKVVRQTLSPEQLPAYETEIDSIRRRRRKIQRQSLLRTLGRNSPLTAEQQERLMDLVQDVPDVPDGSEQLYAFVIVASARIPKAKFRAILDDEQWNVMEVLYRNAAAHEPELRRRGELDVEDLEP